MRRLPVLNKGFIELEEWMGGDPAVVRAARICYQSTSKSPEADERLIHRELRREPKVNTIFEHAILRWHVKCPIFVARQWMRHRMGCLSGDALLHFDLPKGTVRGKRAKYAISVRDFYRRWHHGTSHPIPKKKPTGSAWHAFANRSHTAHVSMKARMADMQLRMCNELTGEIEHTTVADIWESGVQPVFEVTLENGYRLKMTKTHQCLTEQGWLTLEQATHLSISPKGTVMWAEDSPAFAVNGIPAYRDKEWLAARKQEGLGIQEIADLELEFLHAYQNGEPLARFAKAGKQYLVEKTRPKPVKLVRSYSRVKCIKFAGYEMTYDLEVTGPYHNLVADGFIVHNSFNEQSLRYCLAEREYYIPPDKPDTDLYCQHMEASFDLYERLVAAGWRKEQARAVLGTGVYTEFIWTVNAWSFMNWLTKRLDKAAQWEHRQYALAAFKLWREVMPVTAAAFAGGLPQPLQLEDQ